MRTLGLFPMDVLLVMNRGGLNFRGRRLPKNQLGAYSSVDNTVHYNSKTTASTFLHECMHCLDSSMKENRFSKKESFEWNTTPKMKSWGKRIRKEYDSKRGEIVYSKKYKVKVFDDEWLDDYEGRFYNDIGGSEYITRRAQYMRDNMIGKGEFSNKNDFDYKKGAPVISEFLEKLFIAGAKEERFYE